MRGYLTGKSLQRALCGPDCPGFENIQPFRFTVPYQSFLRNLKDFIFLEAKKINTLTPHFCKQHVFMQNLCPSPIPYFLVFHVFFLLDINLLFNYIFSIKKSKFVRPPKSGFKNLQSGFRSRRLEAFNRKNTLSILRIEHVRPT
jgi:hypothetical protein